MSTGKLLGGIRICAVAALAVLSSMALPNDPQMCLYSVGPGETDSLTVEKTNTQPGYWYDIQGNLTIAKGGILGGGNATTNWIHGVSAQKPAQVVLLPGGALNSHYNGVLAFDGYLAQPAISATPGWDNCYPYVMVVLPTAHPVNADGTASPTNELVRFNSRAYEGFFACQKLENGSPIPVVLSSTGSDSTQETPTGVYLVSGGNVGVPGVENEIVLRSTVTAHGKSYPFTYYLRGADAMEQTVDFPRVNDLGKVTVDGPAGLRVWNLNESNFGTVRFNAAYDSGRMAWATTGVCDFRNAIVRPTVDDALPYADDHVVTIRVSRDVRFDWTQVAASDSDRMNGFLDVNGRTCNVGKVIVQNGAIVTDLSGNGGKLIFGANVWNCTLRTCDVTQVGNGCFRLWGGDRRKLVPGDNLIVDCLFENWGTLRSSCGYAILLNGVGNNALHNEIRNANGYVVSYKQNDGLFAYNVISNTTWGVDDAGAFYKGLNPSMRGNRIEYNYWRDIGGSGGHGSCAIYFDDGDSGDTVFGNVFENCGRTQLHYCNFGAVFSHAGCSNVVRNCLFVKCDRSLGGGPWPQEKWETRIKGRESVKWKNYDHKFKEEIDYRAPEWRMRYPELETFLDPYPEEIRKNAAYDCVAIDCPDRLHFPQKDGRVFSLGGYVRGHWYTNETFVALKGDPGFVDYARRDYRLRPDSEIYRRLPNFKPIPFDKIGLINRR